MLQGLYKLQKNGLIWLKIISNPNVRYMVIALKSLLVAACPVKKIPRKKSKRKK